VPVYERSAHFDAPLLSEGAIVKRLAVVEAFELPAVDIQTLLEICKDLKTRKDVSGHQREELDSLIDELEFYKSTQERGTVLLPAEVYSRVLRLPFDLILKARID
jgi:hypothetical protein